MDAITRQIATWGRDHLLSVSDFDKTVIEAKMGDVPAKAALTILSKSRLQLLDVGAYNISTDAAYHAVKDGIEPPYVIPYRITSKTEQTDNGIKFTPVYDSTITIDKYFNVSYSEPVETAVETSLEDWLI